MIFVELVTFSSENDAIDRGKAEVKLQGRSLCGNVEKKVRVRTDLPSNIVEEYVVDKIQVNLY